MKSLLRQILLTAAILTAYRAVSQDSLQQRPLDSLSIRDAVEIKHRAEKMVAGNLNLLLNAISNNNYESADVDEIIRGAYSGTRTQIFQDSAVRVEPDVDPNFVNSTVAGAVPLDRYLKDLDLYYDKADSNTIEFRNIRSTDVKKKGSFYVKIYFNSVFHGKSKINKDQAFAVTNRFAEVWAWKEKGQWHLYIERLAFFNPADTLNDQLDNVPLKFETNPYMNLTATATAADSAAAIEKQKSFVDKLQQTYEEQELMKDQQEKALYQKNITLGNEARKNQDYTNALKYYEQAHELQEDNPEVKILVRRTNDEMKAYEIQKEKVFTKLIERAELLAQNRQYKEAMNNYQDARKLIPAKSGGIDSIVRILQEKYIVLTDLQEKYNDGQYKEAQKACRDALKKDDKNADYYYMLARCYEKLYEGSKGNENAETNYTQAITLDPYDLAAISARAELYVRTNNNFKAISDYRRYLTIDKENMEMYEHMSALHGQIGQDKAAIADLDEAIGVNPKAPHIYLSKGLIEYRRNEFAAAAENFTNSIQLDSTNALAWFSRGRCQVALNKVPAGASDFATARDRGLDSGDRQIIIIDYGVKFYNLAVNSFANNRLDSALVNIDFAISIDPASALDRFTRGEYLYFLHKYKEAIGAYDEALSLNNAYMNAFYKRGMARMGIADYKEAIVNFRAALQLAPGNVLAKKGEGDADLALLDFADAAATYEIALKLADNSKPAIGPDILAAIYNAKSKAYFELQNYEKAVGDARNAIRYDKNFAEAYFNRGNAYYKQNSLSDAIEDIGKALSFEDHHARWHYVMAMTYEQKKDYTNALNQYASCAQQDSAGAFPQAIYKQGYCNYLLQSYDAAVPFYNRALSMQLDSSLTNFNIEFGTVYLNSSKYDSATLFYKKAYNKDTANGYASYGIATVLVMEKKIDESFPWFERSFATKTPTKDEIKHDKLLADFRNNKKFKELLKKYY